MIGEFIFAVTLNCGWKTRDDNQWIEDINLTQPDYSCINHHTPPHTTSHHLTTSASTSTSCFLYLANHRVSHSEDTDRSSSAIVSILFIVYQLSKMLISANNAPTRDNKDDCIMAVQWQHAFSLLLDINIVTEAVCVIYCGLSRVCRTVEMMLILIHQNYVKSTLLSTN